MKKNIKVKRVISNTIKYFLLITLSLFFLFPLFAMVSKSFMTDDEILFFPKLLPLSINFDAYVRAISPKMIVWLQNTIIIIVINIFGITFSSSICAYGFSKIKFVGREVCFAIMLGTLMLPSIAMQIPLYILYSNLGWIGTWYPMTVPGFFGGGAMNIFLMRQFMRGIPEQLSEAAKIDGANSFQIFVLMIIPLCKPIIVFTMVSVFLGTWNDFMTPLMYLQNYEKKFTLSLGLYSQFKSGLSISTLANVQMAAGVMMIIPCLILFFIFQKQLINGVSMSGIKG